MQYRGLYTNAPVHHKSCFCKKVLKYSCVLLGRTSDHNANYIAALRSTDYFGSTILMSHHSAWSKKVILENISIFGFRLGFWFGFGSGGPEVLSSKLIRVVQTGNAWLWHDSDLGPARHLCD